MDWDHWVSVLNFRGGIMRAAVAADLISWDKLVLLFLAAVQLVGQCDHNPHCRSAAAKIFVNSVREFGSKLEFARRFRDSPGGIPFLHKNSRQPLNPAASLPRVSPEGLDGTALDCSERD